ncbi:type II toxin-antitoxin system RelE/ParE family toxin [Pseudorhizobium pelagicum]|uniref:type II toxin-antitoxin system RelE/ParE family toxin n=1 Tax=Pseudorhizobium pelagicum TaxID=1509405 RepID=UPI0009E07155|nr:type II toxin-antitoxin system RelE/ParE family toxin [Pseudorhizobium pelagicum]
MLSIVRTDLADEDLIEIWSYIAVENIVAADRVLDAIEARWQHLARHPDRAPLGGVGDGIGRRTLRHGPGRSACHCGQTDERIIAHLADGFQSHVTSPLYGPLVIGL